MASTNNFKQLAQEDQELIPYAPKQVEQQVMGVVKTSQFAGNVIELYFSKMIEMFMMLLGVTPKQEEVVDKENNSGEAR